MGLPFNVIINTRDFRDLELAFFKDFEDIFSNGNMIPEIKEFSEINVKFISEEKTDKLYLRELDDFELNNRKDSGEDDLYFLPSQQNIIIYEHNKQDVPLVPGYYFFEVHSLSDKYFSAIKIIPKDLSSLQWENMRDEIESKVRGLSLDFIRRKRTERRNASDKVAPNDTFVKIKNLSEDIPAVLSSLEALKKEAKVKIRKDYSWKNNGSKAQIDFKTIKMMQKNPDRKGQLYSANRFLDYDTEENQWLKFILTHILRFSKNSIEYLDRILEVINKNFEKEVRFSNYRSQANNTFINSTHNHRKLEIEKLRKQLFSFYIYVNDFLGEKYFSSVSNRKSIFLPKTLVLSPKYNIVYKMYLKNIRTSNALHLDDSYNYFWRKTDLLYEIWTYIKTIDSLIEMGFVPESGWIFDYDSWVEPLPFLEDGTKVKMSRETTSVSVVFNEVLKGQSFRNTLDNPLKTSSNRKKPDIRIDLFDEQKYAGSIILDAKYKKLINIISSRYNTSSLNQLRSYRNDPFSSIIDIPDYLLSHIKPVASVFAIYPISEGKSSPKDFDEQQLFFSELRPGYGFEQFTIDLSRQINERLDMHKKTNKG
ncbi:nuclease domain-containing protein [Lactococcus cremoris]|uniref:DUF2357 domain-containing protein n=1 Tax=Lactococcus lactis subsp. cremoris TaxID=1359 RepID=UPI0024A6901A|nr:DUF2357 domain-containing protein [Lactococcus cremoris]